MSTLGDHRDGIHLRRLCKKHNANYGRISPVALGSECVSLGLG